MYSFIKQSKKGRRHYVCVFFCLQSVSENIDEILKYEFLVDVDIMHSTFKMTSFGKYAIKQSIIYMYYKRTYVFTLSNFCSVQHIPWLSYILPRFQPFFDLCRLHI